MLTSLPLLIIQHELYITILKWTVKENVFVYLYAMDETLYSKAFVETELNTTLWHYIVVVDSTVWSYFPVLSLFLIFLITHFDTQNSLKKLETTKVSDYIWINPINHYKFTKPMKHCNMQLDLALPLKAATLKW